MAASTIPAVAPPSGEQVLLRCGELTAVVAEVGATLRSLRAGECPIVWEFQESEIASGGRGQVLFPWPNRLSDGRFDFEAVLGTAALDEPERHNAIHGLVRWWPFRIGARSDSAVTLSCTVHPQPAYPFRMRLDLRYSLSDQGLQVSCTATNTGDGRAPLGIGFHPYLDAGPAGVDGLTLELPASTHIVLDSRGLPVGHEPRADSATLPQSGRLAGAVVDDCYTDLVVGDDGRWHARVTGAPVASELWADAEFGYVMCYTGDTLAPPADRRHGLAVEPMTCPPDALRSGEALVVLAQGAQFSASWGIRPL